MSKNIVKILEDNGFNVNCSDGEYELQQYTPEGEDWYLSFKNLEEITEYAEDFDPDEEFDMWWNARKTVSGVPQSASVLLKDQLWKQELLLKIKNEIENMKGK